MAYSFHLGGGGAHLVTKIIKSEKQDGDKKEKICHK
jgi:hypothetical protein